MNRAPTEDEMEAYLNDELMLRRAKGEPDETALAANYRLGLELRDAAGAKYPTVPVPSSRVQVRTRLFRSVKGLAAVSAILVVGWAASTYFGSRDAGIVIALVAVWFLYTSQKIKIEDLATKIDAVDERIGELEATVKDPARRAILDDFETWRRGN